MTQFTTGELLDIFERLAEQTHDGHLTIMRFSRCWKVMPGTPDLDGGSGRKQVRDLPEFSTLRDALIYGILKQTKDINIIDPVPAH
jgi:hypothetical protein